ncbi:hypothetical protein L9F63_009548, partial [Diploptera punctata]
VIRKVKVLISGGNSATQREDVLTSIYPTEIPALYGTDKNQVWVHQDKASSHTSATSQALGNKRPRTIDESSAAETPMPNHSS